jgi:flagellar protein FliO/FliZ
LPETFPPIRHLGSGTGASHAVGDNVTTLLTTAAALAGVVGTILVIGWALRHTSMRKLTSSERLLIVKDTVALDARRRLYLVQHGDRAVLLLTGGANDIVVGWLDGSKSP